MRIEEKPTAQIKSRHGIRKEGPKGYLWRQVLLTILFHSHSRIHTRLTPKSKKVNLLGE